MIEQSPRPAELADAVFQGFDAVLAEYHPELKAVEIGTVISVDRGTARLNGLPSAQADELLEFRHGILGMAFNLDADEVGVILLDDSEQLQSGSQARRTGRLLDVPVGKDLLGRVVDPVGRPLDQKPSLETALRRPVERDAPPIMDRAPVTVPLQTGLKVVDALIPVGRGQRELILGDRQTGKTALAIDTILNQRGRDMICIYCSIAQRTSAVARVVAELRESSALEYCVVVVAEGNAPPGLQFVAPYAATTIGEFFMEQGQDVLVIYDDLTAHARAYRELSLLLRRPPGREAFPGDIFYVHSRLLERSTHLRKELGGGSLTALPIAETEAQNVAAYIPTNLISITDGQIYLSPDLFRKGMLPAVDVGRSVSRVGGKTQLPAYRRVAGDLRLSYSQFEELEAFSRFSSRLDAETRQSLERGHRVREVLKQPQGKPLSAPEQVAVLVAVTAGVFDALTVGQIAEAEANVRRSVLAHCPELCQRIVAGEKLTDEDVKTLKETTRESVSPLLETNRAHDGEPGTADSLG